MTSAFGTFPVSPLAIAALIFGILGALFIIAGLAALIRIRPVRFVLRTLAGLLLLGVAGCAGMVAVGIGGYRALTREDVAARVLVRPAGRQRFAATFTMPDRADVTYQIAGDEIYVDAHILKWTPMANVLGLHTVYQLDRVAGRYADIAQERTAERTVYPLTMAGPVDLFGLRQRYAMLGRLFDAEYGSATFIPVTRAAAFDVLVSTSGLLIREVAPGPPPSR